MPHVVRFILTGRQARHFAGLQNIMNINEVQRSNGVTRRNLVVEWCVCRLTNIIVELFSSLKLTSNNVLPKNLTPIILKMQMNRPGQTVQEEYTWGFSIPDFTD